MTKVREALRIGDFVVDEVDFRALEGDDLRALNAWENLMTHEARPEDPPDPLEMTEAWVRNLPNFIVRRDFWARTPDGEIAASATLRWKALEENRHVARGWIGVRRDVRRRGIARELLRLCADVMDGEERTLLNGTTTDRIPSGDAFCERIGADVALRTHTNRLVLAGVDRERIRKWVEQGPLRAEDYSLVAVDGRYPDELAEQVVACHDIMNTAPRDDLEVEDEHYTVEHMREQEQSLLAANGHRWSLFVRHEPSGELIGFTEVCWFPTQPDTVFQFATAVRPDHRGHALGKWLKAVMLERVLDERPGVVDIRTGNADSNDAMLGINLGMGFEHYIAETGWQVSVERVRAYLGA